MKKNITFFESYSFSIPKKALAIPLSSTDLISKLHELFQTSEIGVTVRGAGIGGFTLLGSS